MSSMGIGVGGCGGGGSGGHMAVGGPNGIHWMTGMHGWIIPEHWSSDESRRLRFTILRCGLYLLC